jgi:hypothetical protein
VVHNIFTYLNPRTTALVSKDWHKMTKACELNSLTSLAQRLCNDLELGWLVPREISPSLKELKEFSLKEDSEEKQILVLNKVKEIFICFKKIAKQADDYVHFSKALREQPIPCYFQLLQKNYEHQQLRAVLKFLVRTDIDSKVGLKESEVKKAIKFTFPMTDQENKKMERIMYLYLSFLMEIKPIRGGGNEKEFEELKQKVVSNAQRFIAPLSDMIVKSKEQFIQDSPVEIKSLSSKQIFAIVLSRLRNPRKISENSDVSYMLQKCGHNLIHSLNLIK